ncbi:MAG: transposase [Desulfobacterales bacterium]|nr:transposase [Desulfobacterales bacterium]
MKELAEVRYPEADMIRLVCDNLNTHKIGSLYETFPPEQARRQAKRLEIHYTPKHGSWLNIAEIELSALTRQCLDRRIQD